MIDYFTAENKRISQLKIIEWQARLHITGVWQNGGIIAKLSICTSINICANLNICASNPPLRQAPKRYQPL
jgi:predicted ATP-dependent Lon-type protease